MSTPILSPEEQAGLATWVSGVLTTLCDAYVVLCGTLAAELEKAPSATSVSPQMRTHALELAGLAAQVSRTVDETVLRTRGQLDPHHDPRPVLPLVRMIGESATLMAAASSPGELAGSYLADPEVVAAAYNHARVSAFRSAHPHHAADS